DDDVDDFVELVAGRDHLPDADVVDEHVRRVRASTGITATGTGDRKAQDRKQLVAGGIELPVGQRARRGAEVGGRAVGVVRPEAHARIRPLHPPGVPGTVDGDALADVFAAVQLGVDGGACGPLAVAVPLHDVDFAAVVRVVVGQIPGGPGAGRQAV